MIKAAIIAGLSVAGTGAVTAAGYGLLYLADNRYLQQQVWVEEKRAGDRRELQRQIDRLEFIQDEERDLTKREKWELKRLESELEELR